MIDNRKGVSTYISVLLLIVVVVSGGMMLYGYTMGWFGRLGGQGEMGTITLDSALAYSSNDTVIAFVRNVGASSVEFDEVYVADLPASSVVADSSPLAEGEVTRVRISGGFTLTAGRTYEVLIVGIDNTQLVFNVKAQ
jgi:FlaG/FlaF family flagellin (archaellin)